MEDDAMKKGKRPNRRPEREDLGRMLSVLIEHQSYCLRLASTLTAALDSCDRRIRAIRRRMKALEKGGLR